MASELKNFPEASKLQAGNAVVVVVAVVAGDPVVAAAVVASDAVDIAVGLLALAVVAVLL